MIPRMSPEPVPLLSPAERRRLLRRANALALVTIGYNVLEGLVSVGLRPRGRDGRPLRLRARLLRRGHLRGRHLAHDAAAARERGRGGRRRVREDRAARDRRGVLPADRRAGADGGRRTSRAAGRPETTFWGIVVAAVSIVTMWLLIRLKIAVGRALGSAAILADAACTRACLALSFVLLAASLGYAATGIAALDTLGALAIAALAVARGARGVREGPRRHLQLRRGAEARRQPSPRGVQAPAFRHCAVLS